MLAWSKFATEAPELADTAIRLLAANEVALLGTSNAVGRPRIHPIVPRIFEGRLIAFIVDSSPKYKDLCRTGWYAIHTAPADEDEEFFVSGKAILVTDDPEFRKQAARAMGFVTGVTEREILFEFLIDRALWTQWLDFGTPEHRPQYKTWVSEG